MWRWFLELHAARAGGFGPGPVGYAEIAAWAALTRQTPRAIEVEWLRALDVAYLGVYAENEKANRPARKP